MGTITKKTYQHIEDIAKELGIGIIRLKSKKYNGMVDLAEKKKRFSSTKARFCTEELKVKPLIDYILDKVNDNIIIIQGIRADESPRRRLMKKQCTFFKFYFMPYGKNKKGKAQYHTYRKKDVIKFTDKYADDIIRPVFEWTAKEVIDFILKNGLTPNPLYYEGFKRVGCFPCIQANKNDIKQICNRYPEKIEELAKIERELGHTFFPPDYIPERACSKKVICKDGSTKKVPTIKDVVKYIEDKNSTIEIFKEEPKSCMSFYSLCE